jgi:hypothetical protein
MKKLLAAASIALAISSSSCDSQELPKYDVEGICRRGGVSIDEINGCIDKQQNPYDLLLHGGQSERWENATPDMKKACIQELNLCRPEEKCMYLGLYICISFALRHAAQERYNARPTKTFKY